MSKNAPEVLAKPTPPIEYNIFIEGQGYQHQVEWGRCPGWATRYREDLDNAHRISLVPRVPGKMGPLPIVTVDLSADGLRWVIFSRIFGRTDQYEQLRLYGIGWQTNIRGRNVKSISWVYPNGAVEIAEEPSMWSQFLDLLRGTSQAGKVGNGGKAP